jgi:hypothetical protein
MHANTSDGAAAALAAVAAKRTAALGDYTFCQMEAKDLSLAMATLVAAAFYNDDGYPGTDLVKYAQQLMDGQRLTIEEIPVGYSEDLFLAVLAVQEETGIDFRFRLWEDPKYEWLGTMHYHIPGMTDVSADCNTGGDVMVSGHSIVEMLDNPLYPNGIDGWARIAACTAHVRAWALQSW